jgi:hypothetical protein
MIWPIRRSQKRNRCVFAMTPRWVSETFQPLGLPPVGVAALNYALMRIIFFRSTEESVPVRHDRGWGPSKLLSLRGADRWRPPDAKLKNSIEKDHGTKS